jgi:hypothetical protein
MCGQVGEKNKQRRKEEELTPAIHSFKAKI